MSSNWQDALHRAETYSHFLARLMLLHGPVTQALHSGEGDAAWALAGSAGEGAASVAQDPWPQMAWTKEI